MSHPPSGMTDFLERPVVTDAHELVPERRVEEAAGRARRLERRLDRAQEDRADAHRRPGARVEPRELAQRPKPAECLLPLREQRLHGLRRLARQAVGHEQLDLGPHRAEPVGRHAARDGELRRHSPGQPAAKAAPPSRRRTRTRPHARRSTWPGRRPATTTRSSPRSWWTRPRAVPRGRGTRRSRARRPLPPGGGAARGGPDVAVRGALDVRSYPRDRR